MKKVFLVFAVVVLLVTGCGKKEETKVNDDIDKTVKSFVDQTIDDIQIMDFNLNFEDGMTNAYAKVKNLSKEDVRVEQIDVTLTDKDGKETKSLFYIGRTIKAGEAISVNALITGNVAASTKVEYQIKK